MSRKCVKERILLAKGGVVSLLVPLLVSTTAAVPSADSTDYQQAHHITSDYAVAVHVCTANKPLYSSPRPSTNEQKTLKS